MGWRDAFPFESRFISLRGHRFHYIDEGEGPPLVFSHGNPTWVFHWRSLVTRLRSHYRVVALDHLGSGWSDKPEPYAYRLQSHAEHLGEFVDRLSIRNATLVGHDWGGAIGLHCALFGDALRFQSYVLLNTGAFPPPRIPWRIGVCRWPLIGPLLVRGCNVFPRAALHMAVTDREPWSPAERSGILAPYGSWRDRAGIWGFLKDIPSSKRHPTYDQLLRLQRNLHRLRDQPVLLIWGMRDWCFDPHCLGQFRDLLPGAEVVELPSAGHWVVEDAPEQVASAIERFLVRHVPVVP